MKVLNIIQKYYPSRGGAELFMQIVSEYLAKELNYDVDVWTTNALRAETLWDLEGETIQVDKALINGVKVRRFSFEGHILNHKYINKIYRVLFSHFPNWKIQNLASCPTIFSMLKEAKSNLLKNYDYITVTSSPYYFLFYVGYIISKRFNIPYIIIPALHVGKDSKDSLRKKYLRKSILPFLKYADKIVLNTRVEGEYIYDFCKKNGVLIDKEKLILIGQGIFLDKILIGNGERFKEKYSLEYPIVFQVGSKTFDKGSFNLIKAMKLIWDQGGKYHLVFAGQSNREFTKYIESLDGKYKKYILNINNISDQEKWDLYDAGDLFSMVSKTDSFGIVYLESWAYRKPVLGCNNAAMREVISNNSDGFLVDFDDIRGISKKIKYLLDNKERRLEMGSNGFIKVREKYDWNRNLKKVAEIYKKSN